MDEETKKKLDELCDIVTAIQEKNDRNEKKYDGLDVQVIKELEIKTGEVTKAFDTLNAERAEEKKRMDELEAIVARGQNGGGDKPKSDIETYDESIMAYIRNGIAVPRDVAKKGIQSMLHIPGMTEDQIERKTMQVGIDPQGGYWVRPERLAKVVDREFETSPIRSVASVITTSVNSVELIIDDDEAETGGWTSEVAPRTATGEPDIGQLEIYTHEQWCMPKITQTLLDDAGFDVGAWLQRKVNSKIGRTENTAFVAGNGANKPKGFLSYANYAAAGVYQRDRIEQIVSGNATQFTADGLIDLQGALKEVYQGGATWLMQRNSWVQIIKLKETATGAYLIDPTMLRNGAGQLVLLGKPVLFADDMQAVGAGALAATYGNFRTGYTIVDKMGVVLIRDNITDKGRILFYTSKRTGGAVTNYEALKTQEISL